MFEKAGELGRLISQMPEYAYLSAARREIGEDKKATALLKEIRELQAKLVEAAGRGEEPDSATEEAFEALQDKIQTNTRYQLLISSQANFDKLMSRVDRAISEGVQKGRESRIIVP